MTAQASSLRLVQELRRSAHKLDSRFFTTIAVVCLLLAPLPFVVAPIPVMPDVFNHTARYYLIYASQETLVRLRAYYEVHWSLLSNMGMDLLVYPFIKVFGVETGSYVATALLPPLTILSLVTLSRAVWGRTVVTLFLALPFVYAYSFLFGFVNYHLSLALAFFVAAGWIANPSTGKGWRWLIYMPLSFCVWTAHLGGWMVLVCLIGSVEMVAARQRGCSLVLSPFQAAWASTPVLLPIILNVVGSLSRHEPTQIGPLGFRTKFGYLKNVLASEYAVFDVACVVLLILLAAYLIRTHAKQADPRLLLASVLFAVVYAIIPSHLLGSFYADERILPPLFMVLFLSFAPTGRRLPLVLLTIGLVIFASRLGLTTVGWYDRGSRAVADLAVLDTVPPQSRVAVFGIPSFNGAWMMHGLDELPSLLIVRRQAFVNSEWDSPAPQLMRPVFNRDRGFNDTSSTYEKLLSKNDGLTPSQFIATLPKDRFDYVWSFSSTPLSAPWLDLIATAPDGRLYQILKSSN